MCSFGCQEKIERCSIEGLEIGFLAALTPVLQVLVDFEDAIKNIRLDVIKKDGDVRLDTIQKVGTSWTSVVVDLGLIPVYNFGLVCFIFCQEQ